MTDFQKYFLDQLDYNSLIALEHILRSRTEEGLIYVTKRLAELSMNKEVHEQALELSKKIPMHYVPMFGVNLRKKPWRDWSVYHYHEMKDNEKEGISFFNSVKISNLDCAVDFLLNHLEYKIRICKSKQCSIPNGIELLNENLEEKRQLIDEKLDEKIFSFFIHHEEDGYIFCIKKGIPILDGLFVGLRRPQLVEMLARYSDLEDLKSSNIESFQKFIRKDN